MDRLRRTRCRPALIACALGLTATLFAAGAMLLPPPDGPASTREDAAPATTGRPGDDLAAPGGDRDIQALRERLRRVPADHTGWAELGVRYVQRAQTSADPQYYAKAERALRRSRTLSEENNHLASMGLGALAAARHDFTTALQHAREAVHANPHHAPSYGVLSDAYLQLGRYDEAFKATQRMVDLQPATPSLARASYTWELRGETERAEGLMRRALDAAAGPHDIVFARNHLALLALDDGRPRDALVHAEKGLRSAPHEPALLAARARAYAALGRTEQAVADYRSAIARVPQPSTILALADLLQSLGRTREAEEQYELFRTTTRLFRTAGVAPEAEAVLFSADHGDIRQALALGRAAATQRPFVTSLDAYAWALHRAGRSREALRWADRALALGTRSALFHYHRGRMHQALDDTDAARGDLSRALDIDPHFHPLHAPRARAALDEIGPT
ncbi:tetratricopeptide repeat protein [Streptomyces sp. JJ38]|uniref:tetratricopeptide repeat protein n=1 Tax=Streptomyces sp. JJ38 TaxID=2738128 RepID=UPI0027D91F57|nr:tetratricopeptide repeat protein [Streptomyces sp. JJ38]MBW1598223.1 tetratricopeptide repeat protein [Streptomyces sp. JJ38]